MPLLPNIGFRVVCEGVRPEPNGKAIIFGFYGVTPYATIIVEHLRKPVAALMFLVHLGGPSDEIAIGAQIVCPAGDVIATTKGTLDLKLPAIPRGQNSLGGVGFAGLSFPAEGEYQLRVLINESVCHSTTFAVRTGTVSRP